MSNISNHLPLSILQVSGADAATFLQQQLTQDVLKMNANDQEQMQARAFCYCQHQGKIIANGLILKTSSKNTENLENLENLEGLEEDVFFLIIEKSVAEIFLKKISMYILRAKVKIKLLDSAVLATSHSNLSYLNFKFKLEFNFLNLNYYIHFNQNDLKNEFADGLAKDMLTTQAWQLHHIQQSFIWVHANITSRFTPHMLALDELTVNFQKGCYPGQEVVARTQYLGKNKKELKIIHLKITDSNFNNLTIESSDFVKNSLAEFLQTQPITALTDLAGQCLSDQNTVLGDIIQALEVETGHYIIMLCGQKEA